MIGTILFGLVALVAVAAAIGMLISTNAVHAALYLVINLLCVAMFYLGLHAPFLAMVQISVYAGAIMVLFLFVIMLLGAERVYLQSRLRWQAPLAIVLVAVLLSVSVFILISPQVGLELTNPQPLGEAGVSMEGYGSPQAVGELLFTQYMLPFQMTGVLLLVAMIGAIVLAKEEKKPKPQTPVGAAQDSTAMDR